MTFSCTRNSEYGLWFRSQKELKFTQCSIHVRKFMVNGKRKTAAYRLCTKCFQSIHDPWIFYIQQMTANQAIILKTFSLKFFVSVVPRNRNDNPCWVERIYAFRRNMIFFLKENVRNDVTICLIEKHYAFTQDWMFSKTLLARFDSLRMRKISF